MILELLSKYVFKYCAKHPWHAWWSHLLVVNVKSPSFPSKQMIQVVSILVDWSFSEERNRYMMKKCREKERKERARGILILLMLSRAQICFTLISCQWWNEVVCIKHCYCLWRFILPVWCRYVCLYTKLGCCLLIVLFKSNMSSTTSWLTSSCYWSSSSSCPLIHLHYHSISLFDHITESPSCVGFNI